MLVYRMPNLMAIDGIPVSEEERTKAELYFLEQQPASVTGPPGLETGTLPGIIWKKVEEYLRLFETYGGNRFSFFLISGLRKLSNFGAKWDYA